MSVLADIKAVQTALGMGDMTVDNETPRHPIGQATEDLSRIGFFRSGVGLEIASVNLDFRFD